MLHLTGNLSTVRKNSVIISPDVIVVQEWKTACDIVKVFAYILHGVPFLKLQGYMNYDIFEMPIEDEVLFCLRLICQGLTSINICCYQKK